MVIAFHVPWLSNNHLWQLYCDSALLTHREAWWGLGAAAQDQPAWMGSGSWGGSKALATEEGTASAAQWLDTAQLARNLGGLALGSLQGT